MVRRNSKRLEKLRKMRCESADSGVDTSLNNSVFQQIQSSRNDFNGLEEEHLDFEPECGDDEVTDSERHSNFQLINSDESTVKIVDSDSREAETLKNGSTSTISIGHSRDMLPVPQITARDGRQHEYIPFVFTRSTGSRTLIDSSSDEFSNDSESHENVTETEDDMSRSQNFYDSGGQDSDCNISQEEEDRLLDSSEDESNELPMTRDSSSLEFCRVGNSLITIPKFFNTNVPENIKKSKDLKRPIPVANLQKKKRKKKRWDLCFKPETLPMRIFLDDIGYIPPNEGSDTEEKNKLSPSKKLFVICNEKDKIVCEKSAEEMQREVSYPSSVDSNFKLPLPPLKRPPTRPKRTVCNSTEPNKNLQIQVVNKRPEFAQSPPSSFSCRNLSFMCTNKDDPDKDDSISIIASTINDDIDDTTDDSYGMRTSPLNKRDMERNIAEPIRNSNYSKEWVENWIQNVPNHQPTENTSEPPVSDDEPTSTNERITFLPPDTPNGYPRINFKDIPLIFKGLCYYQYFKGNCNKPMICNLLHFIAKDKYTDKFKKSNAELLTRGYHFALKYDRLFKEIYPCFLMAFGSLKMHNELTMSIKDLLQIQYINTTEALDTVIQAFMSSGLSFLDTIEKISFNVGFLQYPVLADILLDLITRKPNISENWEVIVRIAKARGNISPDIARRILNRVTSVYPVNKNLCLEIYNFLIKNKMTDTLLINDDILAPFRAMDVFRDKEAPADASVASPNHLVLSRSGPSEREILAATIDNNLIKERERFEREAANKVPKSMSSSGQALFNSFNYRTGITNTYESTDLDDRYFMPNPRREEPYSPPPMVSFNSRHSGNSVSSSSSSALCEGISSPSSNLHFEPPELSEYVPETLNRRVDVRNESTSSRQYPTIFHSTMNQLSFKRQMSDVTLTPAIPIFGKPQYRNDFQFDLSLHNLLPDVDEHVSIDEVDVALLNYAIKSQNGAEFYSLLERYKPPATVENFITMTLAHLKACENGPYELLTDLIQALETEKPDYAMDVHIKAILETVIMNMLFELERRGHWDKARKLLERFCDWDSLISSKIFPKRKLTHMGRYIFLANVFAKGKNYHFTSEILQSPNLHLLESVENWPYSYDPQVDIKSRNVVMTDFFREGYRYNIADVSDMFRRVYKYNGIYGYDPFIHFNPMLISIMNGQQVSLLKYFYADIDIYYKAMDKNVLRAFTILLANQLSQENLFKLYEMCCYRQIYTHYNGSETSIILRTNMLDTELQLIISYYLEKILLIGRPPNSDVLITIRMFESKVLYPKILQKCVRSVQEINEKVREVLMNGFGICIKDGLDNKPTVVELSREALVDCLQRSRRRFLPFIN